MIFLPSTLQITDNQGVLSYVYLSFLTNLLGEINDRIREQGFLYPIVKDLKEIDLKKNDGLTFIDEKEGTLNWINDGNIKKIKFE